MLLTEQIEIKWRTNNRDWYEARGYEFTKSGDSFIVNVNDLSVGSRTLIDIRCDYCGDIFTRRYSLWNKARQSQIVKKDSCRNCVGNKTKESNVIKYGVDNVMNVSSFRDKQRESMIMNHGVEYPLQSIDILNKYKETNMQKYGVDIYAKTQECIDRTKETNIQRYGNECYLHSKQGIEATKKRNMERFGVEYASQSEYVRKKVVETLYKNGTISTSSQQRAIHRLIGGKLNFPFGRSSLDIAFPEEKIYLEYDGGGHNLNVKLGDISQDEFNKKEQRRSFFLKDNGWKEIRIITDEDNLPKDKNILDFVKSAKSFLNSGKGFSVKWNIDDGNKVLVNYTHTYEIEEFKRIYCVKEVV